MTSPTVNGKDILHAVLVESRVGVWTAELHVDSDTDLSGAVTVEIDGVSWQGTVLRGAAASGRVFANIVGGKGGLAKVLAAKAYYQSTSGTVLSDLMRESGETLAADSDGRARTHTLARWLRSRATAAQAVKQVATELGLTWRVRRDGQVWLGTESWPEVAPEYEQVNAAPHQGQVTIAPEQPLVRPGVLFQGKHVSAVTTRVTAAGLRQEVIFDDDVQDPHGRLLRGMAQVVEGLVGNRIDYSRFYPAKVSRQHGDGSLDVICDDPLVRGTGITHVPIRHGLPGVKVKVPAGGKVLVFWENGNPLQPAAALWPDGSAVTEISIKAPTIIVDGDLVVSGEVTAKSSGPNPIKLSAHMHPTAMGPSDAPKPIPGA